MIAAKTPLLRWLLPPMLALAGDPAVAVDAVPSPAVEPPVKRWLLGDGASGDWFGVRPRLSQRGFTPYATWTGEVFRNFDGGLRTGTDWQGLLEFGADLDLEKAVAWNGAGVHGSALWIQNGSDPSADLVGNFDEVSNIAGAAALRFYRLYFEQELRDGAFGYKVGQLALDDDFMTSDGSSTFLNASFGTLPVESANTPAPIYPLGALGGWGRWLPRKDLTLQAGIYAGDAGTQVSNDTGFDYELGSSEGWMVLAEMAIDTAPLGRDATCKIGGYYHSGDFTDFDSGTTVSGTYALYVIVDQVLVGTREDNRLAAFLRAGISPLEDRSVVHWYLDAGLAARGFRANDRVGLGFSHSHFGGAFVSAQEAAGSTSTAAESVIELTYSARVTPWFTLQPDLQYVIDPQDADASNAFVGLLRAEITF